MMRPFVLALVLFALACVATTSVTRTGTGLFAPRGDSAEQLKTNIGGASGRVRIGVRSHEFGYIVWTSWMSAP